MGEGASLPRRSLWTMVGARPAGGARRPSYALTLPTLPRPRRPRPDPRGPPAAAGSWVVTFSTKGQTESPRPSFGRESGWAQKLPCAHWARKEGLPGPGVKGGLACPYVSLRSWPSGLPGTGDWVGKSGQGLADPSCCCGAPGLTRKAGPGCQGRGVGEGVRPRGGCGCGEAGREMPPSGRWPRPWSSS